MVPFSNAVKYRPSAVSLLDLGEQRGVFSLAVGVPVAIALLGAGDRVGDEAGGVGVEVT